MFVTSVLLAWKKRFQSTNEASEDLINRTFSEIKPAFEKLYMVFRDKYVSQKLMKVSKRILYVSPFDRMMNHVGSLSRKFSEDTERDFVDFHEKYQYFTEFCAFVVPTWTKLLIHGKLQRKSVTEAYTDFIIQV